MRQNFGRFRGCYRDVLHRRPNLSGRATLRFVIGRDGHVSSSSASLDAIVEATLGDTGAEAFRACLAGAGYALTFPHPEGGVVTVKYPLRLEPDYAARESFYVTY